MSNFHSHDSETLLDLLACSMAGERQRLSYRTVFSHMGIVDYLQNVLGTYSVVAPKIMQSPMELSSALSSWPDDRIYDVVQQSLQNIHRNRSNSADTTIMTETVATNCIQSSRCSCCGVNHPDYLNAHGHELTFYLAGTVVKELRNQPSQITSASTSKSLHSRALDQLNNLGPLGATESLFGRRRCFRSKPLLWLELLPRHDEFAAATMTYESFLFGTPSLTKHLLTCAGMTDQSLVYACPMYVLGYNFDGDELCDSDMREPLEGTAEYTLHPIAIVLDNSNRVLYICDSNGGLLRGGSIEFLSIPLVRRTKATTMMSQYQIDSDR